MRRVRRSGSALAVVAAVAVSLAGCDSSADPVESRTSPATTSAGPTPSASSSSASPTPSASASGPTIPTAARENTPEGAVAFLRFYFETLNEAYKAPEEKLLVPLSTTSCEFCDNSRDSIKKLAKDGHHFKDDLVAISRVKPFGGASPREQFISLEIRQSAAQIVDADGDVIRTSKKGSLAANAAVVWSSGGWKLRGIEKQA